MATTKTSAPASKTATAQAAAQSLPPVEDNNEPSMLEIIKGFASMAGVELPSGKLVLAGFVASLCVGAIATYGTMQLAAYVMVGAIALTSSAFLGFAAMILVAAVGIYGSLLLASKVGSYIGTGGFGDDVVSAKNWVTGFFSSEKKLVRAAPVGAA